MSAIRAKPDTHRLQPHARRRKGAGGHGVPAGHRAGKDEPVGRMGFEYPDFDRIQVREQLEESEDGRISIVERLLAEQLCPLVRRDAAVPWMDVPSPPLDLHLGGELAQK